MTPSDVQLAALVGPHVQLRDVRQVAVSAALLQIADAPFSADVNPSYGWNREDGLLICNSTCELTVTGDGGQPEEPAFTASTTFVAVYEVDSQADLPDEAFEAFTRLSATSTLHPYIREALQSLTVRAGMPPFVLATQLHPVVPTDMERPVDEGATVEATGHTAEGTGDQA